MLNLTKKTLYRRNSPIYAYERGTWEGYRNKNKTVVNGCVVTTIEWDWTCVDEPKTVFCTPGDSDQGSRTITDC